MQPWNIVFLICFIVYTTIRGVFEQRTKNNEKIITKNNAQDRILMVIVFIGSLLLPMVYLFTALLSFADYLLPSVVPWCGIVVMLVALWLFWRSHIDLGANWSVTLEIRKGHDLVTNGVYKYIRHPMYAAIWLFGLGQGLLLQNWLAGWSAFFGFALMYFVRTPQEERMMCEFFGQEYRDYMQRTNRIFPLFLRRKQ